MQHSPALSTKCDDTSCAHTFADHYTTYDGKKSGCVHATIIDQLTSKDCHCDGFKTTFRFPGPVSKDPDVLRDNHNTLLPEATTWDAEREQA